MNFWKKLFTSRFFIITVCTALLISIIPTVLVAMGQGSYVRGFLQTVSMPFRWAFTKAGEGLRGYSEYFTTIDRLREENEKLRRELEENKSRVYDASLIEDENRFLRGYLGIKAEHYDFTFQEASVIGREATAYSVVYTLSAGKMSGIEKEMAVISDSGLLGYISETGTVWSRVIAITEDSAAAGVFIERSGASGIVRGTADMHGSGLCEMIRIPIDADVRQGDMVVTSGVGSFYPRGIPVGEVIEVSTDPATRLQRATVRPYADFSRASRVMVVTGYATEDVSDE